MTKDKNAPASAAPTPNAHRAAFARPLGPDDGQAYAAQTGLSKLEYFTAAALTGVLAGDPETVLSAEQVARYAVKVARATLAELEAQA